MLFLPFFRCIAAKTLSFLHYRETLLHQLDPSLLTPVPSPAPSDLLLLVATLSMEIIDGRLYIIEVLSLLC